MSGSHSEKTAGQLARTAIANPYERRAAVLLFLSGWTIGELAMTLQVGEDSIRNLLVEETGVSHIDELRTKVTEEHQ